MKMLIKPLSIHFSLVLLLLLLSSNWFVVGDPVRKPLGSSSRRNSNRVPECGNIGSKIDCLKNQDCRWCRSDVLDDACFFSFALDGFLHDLRFTNLAVVKQRILNLGDDEEK